MARVVQQRTSPPYLLIAFVVGFLAATTLAVVFYVKYDNVQEEKAKTQRTLSALASLSQRRNPRIAKIIGSYRPEGREKTQTVVGQLSSEINKLTESLVGEPTDPENAFTKVEGVYELLGGPRRGLVDEIRLLHDQQKQQSDEHRRLKTDLREKTDEIKKLQEDVQAVTDKLTVERSRLKDQVKSLETTTQDEQQAYQDDLKAIAQRYEQRIDDLNKNITQKVAALEKLQTELARLGQENRRQQQIIQELKGTKGTTEIHPDGKIRRILDESGICYIDLGIKDRIRPGLTFAVYSHTGITEETKSKGSIIVTDPGEDVSKCRILRSEHDDPLRIHDVVSNVAFDRLRTYKFLVVGNFDLYGTGGATKDGSRTVKQLIRKFGGQVTDELSPIETDFIVMGAIPRDPTPPADDAPPSDWDKHQEDMKIWEHYQNVTRDARQLNIPILNTNRFLSLTGYIPEQTLK